MSEVLFALLHLNLALSAAILLALAFRRVVRRHCGADVAYCLWSLLPVIGMAGVVSIAVSYPGLPVSFSKGWLDVSLMSDHAPALTAIWAAGAAMLLAMMIVSHCRILVRARRGEIGPAVIGVIAPRVYMPADAGAHFTDPEVAVLRAHERAHLLRGDAPANALMALVQGLFWFNPLIHVGAYVMRLDQEMACDASVMEERPEQRRRYAATLLKVQLARPILFAGCAWMTHPLEDRVATLARGQASAYGRILGAVAVVLVGAVLVMAYVDLYTASFPLSWSAQLTKVR